MWEIVAGEPDAFAGGFSAHPPAHDAAGQDPGAFVGSVL